MLFAALRRGRRFARAAQAAPYYVTVSGLGGEPDYEQRFTALAKDLDKLFKAAASDAHVYTFTGADATKAHLTDTLGADRARGQAGG